MIIVGRGNKNVCVNYLSIPVSFKIKLSNLIATRLVPVFRDHVYSL